MVLIFLNKLKISTKISLTLEKAHFKVNKKPRQKQNIADLIYLSYF